MSTMKQMRNEEQNTGYMCGTRVRVLRATDQQKGGGELHQTPDKKT